MSAAQVHALQRLADFQLAVKMFIDKAKAAVGTNTMEVRRASDWVASQLDFWKAEIRRAEEAVVAARNELARRKMMRISDRPPDTTYQEKELRKARARLAHAEEKRDHCKAWLMKFPDAVQEYDGLAKPFQDMLEFDMMKMVMFLENKIAALEAYQQINPSSGESR
jgi:DNA repair exonuclease SbcCD ATPase subunit